MVVLPSAVLEKCRLCLNNLGKLIIRDNFGLQQDIYTYLLIKVSFFDDLPQAICEECYKKINDIKNLKTIAKNSEVHLKLLLFREKVNCEQLQPTPNENSLKIKIKRTGDHYYSEFNIEPSINKEVDQNGVMQLRDIVANAYYEADYLNDTGTINTEDENSWQDSTETENILTNTYLNDTGTINTEDENSWQDSTETENILTNTYTETDTNGDDVLEKSSIIDHKFKKKDLQEYICDNCSKIYTTPKKLYHHMRSHNKKYVCARYGCGKRFACKNDLTKHIRVHTGSKPYHCEMCNVSFTQMVGLRSHFKAIHIKIK